MLMSEKSLPPSSKKIYTILEGGEEMTHRDLVEKSNLSSRTVRYALKRLKEQRMIIEKFNFRDARQILYSLSMEPLAKAV